jgi:hypothetical protein
MGDMSNPWTLQKLAQEHERETLGRGRRRPALASPVRAARPYRDQGILRNLVQSIVGYRRSSGDRRLERPERRETFELSGSRER